MTPNNNVFKLACEPIQNVRIGIIGIGNRGLRAIRRYAFIQGAQITAVADLYEDNVNAAEEEPVKADVSVKAIQGLSDDFIGGMDVSSMLSLEESGVTFKNANGEVEDFAFGLFDDGL